MFKVIQKNKQTNKQRQQQQQQQKTLKKLRYSAQRDYHSELKRRNKEFPKTIIRTNKCCKVSGQKISS